MGSNLVPIPITPKKRDPAWKHCQLFKNGEKVQMRCIYCSKMFKGGGIHRIKEHLACLKGNGSTCLSVPPDVRLLMQQNFDKVVVKKRKKEEIEEETTNLNLTSCENDAFAHQSNVNSGLQLVGSPKTFDPGSSSLLPCEERTNNRSGDDGKKRRIVKNSATPANAENFVAIGDNRAKSHIHMAIGRFLYDIGAPLDAVNSAYFHPMLEAIASGGLGVEAPSYHDIRGWILKNSVEEVKNDVGKYTTAWASTGCSVLVDQWITDMGRILLNFSVYSPEATVFLKSVDVSDIINSSDALYELLKQVVEEVGVRHVLQVITNGEEVYMLAGARLTETFPGLYCVPCAAHCLDLILDDFAKVSWMSSTIEKARSITRFVYNHSAVLNMVRKYTSGNDIVEPGDTSISTNFTTLKRLVYVKQNLQSMVTSQEWMDCPYSKKPEGLDMLDLISNQNFWSSCMLITRVTNPLLRVLKIVGSKKRPAMGYIYAGMYRAKETIKKEFVKREDYMHYWNIINRWWERLCLPIHAAGFYFNPKYFYSTEGDMHNEILSRMLDCIERLVPDINIQDKILKELNSYKKAVGDFGRKMAIRARDALHPDEWWSTYGGGCPNLARLAIRILSQTCSSIRFKQNKIHFEQIYGTRNCLERQRLMDLMFVQCNFQLRQMIDKSKQHDSWDPISIDCISLLEDWVMGKDVCLGGYGSVDWPELNTPSPNAMLLAAENDEFEEIGAGFDDYEILNRTKAGEEDIVDINLVG
ncbi:uncharacterized protein LOC119988891 [Tripterygium wilfordii]|uniref:uncharacterized protein LOC119988891 n=1 Tax=Tripterygium wilfordii TaxID=458696 RepID=UPI0018F857C9|nr:uncharacterized protein LOC119988891 [Tripterygium wilfordii]XP_038690057.1 uncharacterized protein LOC119988891 [Tripterygium wilfordii]XP_038690059.1 uncharacterized protein LOC119988891 [Tripterygium wilfordii]